MSLFILIENFNRMFFLKQIINLNFNFQQQKAPKKVLLIALRQISNNTLV